MRVFEGQMVDAGGRYALVAGRFNDFITHRLIEGAEDILRRHGVNTETHVDLVWVPGAYEMPVACDKLAASGRYDAVIALGAVIRGATPHFDFVSGQAAAGVQAVGTKHGLPCIFGVLTTDTIEQAIERAGTKAGNNGAHAARTAVEMVSLFKALEADNG